MELERGPLFLIKASGCVRLVDAVLDFATLILMMIMRMVMTMMTMTTTTTLAAVMGRNK